MADSPESAVKIHCNGCGAALDVTGRAFFSNFPCPHCGATLTVPKTLGHFTLLAVVGTGGSGTVYRAMDTSLQRVVAVKVLKQELAEDAKFVADFSREARAAAALNHPNIAHIYAFETRGGQFYLVMELLTGGSLDSLIEKRKQLTEAETLDFGIQIASALRAAFQRGLIHRDVKPGNVLIGEDGIARLVDFGLARFRDEIHEGKPEAIWATPYYIAPEKLSGNVGDFRSDMYSLGGTLFHCLTGRPPFDAPTANDVVEKNLTHAALSVKTYRADVSDATEQILSRLLRKNPNDRFQDYDALVSDLEKAKRALTAPPSSKKTSTLFVTAMVVLLVLLAAVSFWAYSNWKGEWELRKQAAQQTPAVSPPATITPVASVTPPTPQASATVEVIPPEPVVAQPSPAQAAMRVNFRKGLEFFNGISSDSKASVEAFKAVVNSGETADEVKWARLMLGLLHLMREEDDAAVKALTPLTENATARLKEPMTFDAFPQTLALMLLGKLPPETIENGTLPPWASAAFLMSRAVHEIRRGNFAFAGQALRNYSRLTLGTEHQWLFDFQRLGKLADETDWVARTLETVKNTQATGDNEKALLELRRMSAKVATTTPPLRQALATQEIELTRLIDEKRRADSAQQAENTRLIEQDKNLAARETKLRAAAIVEEAGLLKTYSFDELLAHYNEVDKLLVRRESREWVETQRFKSAYLVKFRERLMADLNAAPYSKDDLFTAQQTELKGSVTMPNTRTLTVTKRIGQSEAVREVPLREMTAAELGKIGEFYLERAIQNKREQREISTRQVEIAVLYKTYGVKQADDWAVKARRVIGEQAGLRFFSSVP